MCMTVYLVLKAADKKHKKHFTLKLWNVLGMIWLRTI